MNPFKFSLDNKRYHTLNYYNKIHFGGKVFKAVIDGGFTCPNADGTKGTGGCIFCDGGSGYFTNGNVSVEAQLASEIKRIRSKNHDAKIIAYFQANTNTYAPAKKLEKLYRSVLCSPEIIGISIGTRADCLDDDVIAVLSDLCNNTNLTVELGLQSVHDSTINYINRKYSHSEFLQGYAKLKNAGIRTCLHIINGLPHETDEMMLETARQAALLCPEAVKLQMLHIISGTQLHKQYVSQPFEMLTMQDYITIVSKQLEFFSPETVIERLTGDGDKKKLVAPMWSANKIAVLGGIDKFQASSDSYQGKYFSEISHNKF